MKYFDEREKCLKDKKIIKALQNAAKNYESGCIAEVRDELIDVINAIDAFDAAQD